LLFSISILFATNSAPSQETNKTEAANQWQKDADKLLSGLSKITAPGAPGAVAAMNDNSFVVVIGEESGSLIPVIAAGELPSQKKGRVVVLGHDGYLFRQALEQHDTGKLVERLARWAANSSEKQLPGLIGIVGRHDIEPVFSESRWKVRKLDSNWTTNLADINTLIITAGDVTTPDDAEVIRKYLQQGGGVIFGITGWGWEQVTSKSLVKDLVIAPVLADAGLAVTNSFASPTVQGGFRIVPAAEAQKAHAGQALKRLGSSIGANAKLTREEAKQTGATLLAAARATRSDELTFRQPLVKMLGQWPRRELSQSKPVGQQDIQDRLAVQIDFELEKSLPAESIKENPSAKIFPGGVDTKAPRITRKITIPAGSRGRTSTALYAPPGGLIEIKSAADGEFPSGLQVRIGAHSDTIWHLDRWERHPDISRVWPITAGSKSFRIASSFGGLIYIELFRPLSEKIELELHGSVQPLHYQLGVTTPENWRKSRESASAPWAELVSKHVGLVLPAASVRGLEDPRILLELWDKIIEVQDQLGSLNPPYKPIQWIVPDQQISAGYMHSGNPIMTFMDVVPFFSRPDRVLSSEPGGVSWGILHEIGHNRQRPEWTPDGLGEVTNNLFALYVYDKMLNQPSSGHPGLLKGENRAKALAEYRKTGPDFNRFKNDPFLALAFFMGIQEKYGWAPFIGYFAEVEKQSRGNRPRTDTARWDQWLVGLSKQVKKDLGPYFKEWGIPVSSQAIESAAKLDSTANP
jgi:hypothetical protein